jgi:hypothetical protein
MARDYRYSDIAFNNEFDIMTEGGDIKFHKDTNNDAIQGYIKDILSHGREDWLFVGEGANIEDFKGEPTTPETAERIKARIAERITKGRLIDRADLSVDYLIIDESTIMFRVDLLTIIGDLGVAIMVDVGSSMQFVQVI